MAPVNNSPTFPNNMNSQQATTVNNLPSPLVYKAVLNSNNPENQQQYHQSRSKYVDENTNFGIMNSCNEKENKRKLFE